MIRPASALATLALLLGALTASRGAASPGSASPDETASTPGGAATPAGGETAQAAPHATGKHSVPEAYRSAAVLGYKEFERGNYVEARAKFLEAHEVYPNARSLRALGAVEYDLRHYAACVGYLELALASEENPLPQRLRDRTEELLERARHYMAIYTVEVSPEAAALTLDGKPVELRPDHTLFMDLGDHELGASLEGFRPAYRRISIASNQPGTLRLSLDPIPPEVPVVAAAPAVVVAQPATPAVREDMPLRKRWWVWAAAGAVLVATVVGLSVGLSGRERVGAPTQGTLGVEVHAAARPGLSF